MEHRPLELWGGVECTVNRVREEQHDQLALSGHHDRPGDLDLFADLGLNALRYPVLWETTAPDGPASADWSFPDERLHRIRDLGMRPIVGLVHHGSGPFSTSLLEDSFATGLAEFAGAAAARYPWVDDWTPVNEPLTTARFSALYGHWYPHLRDDAAFGRAVIVQCTAIVLAMERVRALNPGARLVQTEDIGVVHSTEPLAYQAAFENDRRWLALDLLCGRVDENHPLWDWLTTHGVLASDLRFFLERPCPPDLIGVNYYLSSERFLDHRTSLYPRDCWGGNGTDEYADVLAWRVLASAPEGVGAVLREAWRRYALPVAVTEAHNGCTREEQLRWLREVWAAATALREEGVDVRAVTLWSLLGAFGWDKLVTRPRGQYEPGVFDLRGGSPRPTALVHLARALAAGTPYEPPVLRTRGWWRRDHDRLTHPPHPPHSVRRGNRTPYVRTPPLIITGAGGTLGQEIARQSRLRGIEHRALLRAQLDLASPTAVQQTLDARRPWAVVNAAGYARVDEAETDAAACFRDNALATAVLARACAERGIALVTFSSDLVFDGELSRPYVEDDVTRPLNTYGLSKAHAERFVLSAHPHALVVRTSAFFGPRDRANFVTLALERLRSGLEVVAADDTVVSPTYVPDLVEATLDLLIDGESGIWHLANGGSTSWAEFARAAARFAQLAPRVVACTTEELGLAAARPRFSALRSARGQMLPPLDDALARYVHSAASTAPEARAFPPLLSASLEPTESLSV